MAEEPSSRTTFDLDARLHVTANEGGRTREMSIALLTAESAELVIGRSRSADLSLQDEYISHRHLRVVFRRGQHWVEDLGSTHGTLLNEKPVIRPQALEPGDVVTLGKSKLEYACTKRTLEKLPALPPAPEKTLLTVEPGSGRLSEGSKDVSRDKESTAIGPRTEATKSGAAGEAQSPKPAPPKPAPPKPAPTAGASSASASAGAAGKPAAAQQQAVSASTPAGASAGGVLLAFVLIAAIVALLCYLAWQLFFAGAA